MLLGTREVTGVPTRPAEIKPMHGLYPEEQTAADFLEHEVRSLHSSETIQYF